MSVGGAAGLAGLAVASFAAATPLPFTSEPLFIGLLVSGLGLPLVIVLVASIANTAGSVATYLMARAAGAAGGDKWMPVSGKKREKLEAWYRKWGLWTLLLAWIPGGDLLVILAGLARAPLVAVTAILTFAKTLRFAALALLTLGLFG
ncbi:YqaA family protein [Falsigemmobacter intermedius]|uniref:DedA family protein n=1 Tax=Falsigemmobacter intermedius TaxID=1553448 RepID=A0A444MDG3_9RHOB|nr:VTT domain-containing protein [Falsigemmobacter intermedius]RWY42439.1 DedA family protein [Falsigemmobacter intermedius]